MLNKKALLLTLFMLIASSCGQANNPGLPEAPSAPSDIAEQDIALLSTLSIGEDGTLYFNNREKAKETLGSNWDLAAADLENLNAGIRAGVIEGFVDSSELFDFNYKDAPSSYEALTATSSATCRSACVSHVCCCRGWWIFCWGYCSC